MINLQMRQLFKYVNFLEKAGGLEENNDYCCNQTEEEVLPLFAVSAVSIFPSIFIIKLNVRNTDSNLNFEILISRSLNTEHSLASS